MKHPKKDQKEKRVLRALSLGADATPSASQPTKRQRREEQKRRVRPKQLNQKEIDALYGVIR